MAIVEIRDSDTHERMVSKLNSNFSELRKKPITSAQNTIVIEQTNAASQKYIDGSIDALELSLSGKIDGWEESAESRIDALTDAMQMWLETSLEELGNRIDGMFDKLYPVGSVIVTQSKSDTRLNTGTWTELKNALVFNSIGTETSGTVKKFYVKKSVTDDESGSYMEVDAVTAYMYRRVE